MKKLSFLSASFLCLILSALLMAPPHCQAGAPKILRDSSKHRVTTASHPKTVTPASSRIRTLGRFHDISTTKKRIGSKITKSSRRGIAKKISSRCVIIIDATTGKTIFAKSPDTPRQPASTIKILTGMIALKSLKLSDSVPVSRKAARQPRSKIYLDQKKQYNASDMINAVLLASANDASVAIAEKIAGTEKAFASMMTLRARLWGATRTTCKSATGLTVRGQKSTARDLANIFRYAMQDRAFAKIMKRTKIRTSYGKLLRNHNKALWQVEGAIGGKTGYTNAARQTYVGKFKRGKDEIIVAIMGSETMWADIKQLVEYGFSEKTAMNTRNNYNQPGQNITRPPELARISHKSRRLQMRGTIQ